MKNSIKKTTYRHHLERTRDTSNWFWFFRLYYRIMPRLDALFIQDLHNLSASKKIRKQKIGGKKFFQCTEGFLLKSASEWTPKEQEIRFRSLKKLGYVKTARKGIPSTRWAWINIEGIEQDLDNLTKKRDCSSPNGDHCTSPNEDHYIRSKKKERKNNYSPASPGESGFSSVGSSRKKKQVISKTARRLARQLYDKIVEEKKIKSSTLPFSRWPELMQKIIKRFDKDRVKSAVKWYVCHFGEGFVPEAFSIASFSEKFVRIETAMSREAKKKELDRQSPEHRRQLEKWERDPEKYLHPKEQW